MSSRTKKPRGLKVRRYADNIIDLNDYFSVFLEAKEGAIICETEINENLLNSMTNSWISQAYVQEFDCEIISFKEGVNCFECMEIVESIYKCVVEPYFRKTY